MDTMENGNGKSEFIDHTVGDAIKKLDEWDGAKDHEVLCEMSKVSVRLGEMVIKEFKGLKNDLKLLTITVDNIAEERKIVQIFCKVAAGIMSTTGLLGTVYIVIQIFRIVN